MTTSSLVLTTTKASIWIQLITGIFGAYGLTLPTPEQPGGQLIKDVLKLEMLVQGVEFIFYIFLVYLAHIPSMTLLRYGDWFLSTPTMLFTMAAYFLRYTDSPPENIEQVWNERSRAIQLIWIANFGMLAFGLAGELGLISKAAGFVLGTLCFLVAFGLLYKEFAETSQARPLYYVMVSTWSIYGLAYLQSENLKNILYNGLDILAKNFFGLYLTYILWKETRGQARPKTDVS